MFIVGTQVSDIGHRKREPSAAPERGHAVLRILNALLQFFRIPPIFVRRLLAYYREATEAFRVGVAPAHVMSAVGP